MDKVAECYTTQMIKGDGTFNEDGLDNFIKQIKLEEHGHSYVIFSVMGPQSSGKSTLMNHLFHTNFKEMNAVEGRRQTTQGIWMARCIDIKPCTIVMDIEGTDGDERREAGTAFEKQSALFAIAVSDIVIINMWCHDIGRDHGANKPLLKTVFQVMLRLISPRKISLMFVIRDKTKTPPHVLESDLRKDIEKIWDSIPKPETHRHNDHSEFFNVEVVALSSYEYQEKEFKEQVAILRQKFVQSIAPSALANDMRGVVPASDFSSGLKKIWEEIKENKDLKLPNQETMEATIHCERVAIEKYDSFAANQDWLKLEEAVKSERVKGFGNKLSSLIDDCVSSYDEEVTHYDGIVVSERRKQLYEKLMQLVAPSYALMFQHIQSEAMEHFKTTLKIKSILIEGRGYDVATKESMRRFDELCEDAAIKQVKWDLTILRKRFSNDMDSHITDLRMLDEEADRSNPKTGRWIMRGLLFGVGLAFDPTGITSTFISAIPDILDSVFD